MDKTKAKTRVGSCNPTLHASPVWWTALPWRNYL